MSPSLLEMFQNILQKKENMTQYINLNPVQLRSPAEEHLTYLAHWEPTMQGLEESASLAEI